MKKNEVDYMVLDASHIDDLIETFDFYRYQKINSNTTRRFLESCRFYGLGREFEVLETRFCMRDKTKFLKGLESMIRSTNETISSLTNAQVYGGALMFESIKQKLIKLKLFYSNVDSM